MITIREFGQVDDRKVFLYTITNSKGSCVSITNYGGRVVALKVFDKSKELRDVVLGYDSLDEYVNDYAYLGAIIGRYANRIKDAQYTIDDKIYTVSKNDGENSLHGGIVGFDKILWDASISGQDGCEMLTLQHRSLDGEQGFNGNMDVRIDYSFTDDDSLVMDAYAICDQTTICNICNHSYFNLDGDGERLFYHKVRIFANKITAIDEHLLPTGEYLSLNGALDLRKGRQLRTLRSRHPLIKTTGGYDFNYCINREGTELFKAATVRSLSSGIKMDVFTTKPGIQFYTGNFLNGIIGKQNKTYNRHTGFCLETQFYPDSPHNETFPSAILKKGTRYAHRTIYKFGKQ